MSQISADMIRRLRERTGVGMAKCKEALEAAHGDLERAIENLRKAGMATAVKKEGRETNEGAIAVAEDAHAVALIEIDAETDFVVKNERFQHFLHDMAAEVLHSHPSTVNDFLHQKYSKNPSHTIDQERAGIIQSLGENIKIARFAKLEKHAGRSIGFYTHLGGKIVSLVELAGVGEQALAKEIAMHIVAEEPLYLTEVDVPDDVKEKEREIATAQVKGKPENVIDKIVEGKLKAFYDQVCLLRQKFVKDPSITIAQLIEKHAKASGKTLHLVRFLRWKVGDSA